MNSSRALYPRIVLAVLLCSLVFARTVSAQVGVVEGVYDWIAVWRSPSVIQEGNYLEDAGQYDLAAERMACLVD